MSKQYSEPVVSVLMPVHNGAQYVETAVASILEQTFADFEFVIVDDGSSDDTVRVLHNIRDSRVRVLRSEHIGLVAALNLGLSYSVGEYVARMDSDDVSRVDRFSVQVGFLSRNPEIGLVCSNIRVIDDFGRVTGVQHERDFSKEQSRAGLLYDRGMKPIIHPSVMMRREVVERAGGYREFTSAEDRDLWLRVLSFTRICRIQQDLLDYRIHSSGVSRDSASTQEVSSAMAAVNWLVFERSGVDMFAEDQAMFGLVGERLRERLERDVLPTVRRFRAARGLLRERRWAAGASEIVAASAQARRLVTPDLGRRLTRRAISDEATRALAAISVRP